MSRVSVVSFNGLFISLLLVQRGRSRLFCYFVSVNTKPRGKNLQFHLVSFVIIEPKYMKRWVGAWIIISKSAQECACVCVSPRFFSLVAGFVGSRQGDRIKLWLVRVSMLAHCWWCCACFVDASSHYGSVVKVCRSTIAQLGSVFICVFLLSVDWEMRRLFRRWSKS